MSLRAAINAKCRECLYDPMQPGRWREQVSACTSYGCPLYPVRPVSQATADRGVAARKAAVSG